MRPDDSYRALLLRIADGPRRRAGASSWRESLGTLMLGVLSTSLGAASLIALVMRQRESDMIWVALAGQWLGMAGLYLGRRVAKALPPLPAIGTTLCVLVLSPLYAILLLSLVMILLPIAILGGAVYAVIHTSKVDGQARAGSLDPTNRRSGMRQGSRPDNRDANSVKLRTLSRQEQGRERIGIKG